ncbi:MAG: cell division protein FtsQ [Weeksellaceae bacterium]|nr:cell division protein FtsQ [Weeksellaceae bacterium]
MKNKWRILKILITVVLFGFLLSFSLKRFNDAKMENVSIHMIQSKTPVYFVDEKDIKELVKQYNPTRKIGDINIPELEKKINQIPFVDSANVYLNLNGNLNIDIKQRVPAFRLNKNARDFYVDRNGVEFPISNNFSVPVMLVMGDVQASEYIKLGQLVEKIDRESFSKKFFIGITKEKGNYNLLTSEGHYKVEIGDLNHIDFKITGFKTFVEKYLINQNPEKYKKISLKYDNQIVTTLNPYFKENDSILKNASKIEIKKPEEKAQQNLALVALKKESATQNSEAEKDNKTSEAKKSEPKIQPQKMQKPQTKSAPNNTAARKKEIAAKKPEKKNKTKIIVE